jgi:hypothetical protein
MDPGRARRIIDNLTLEHAKPGHTFKPDEQTGWDQAHAALGLAVPPTDQGGSNTKGEAVAVPVPGARPSSTPANKPVIAGSAMDQWADRTIAESRKRFNAGLDPTVMAAYGVKGAAYIESGIRDLAQWSDHMVKEFGEQIRPHLEELWQKAQEHAAAPRKHRRDKTNEAEVENIGPMRYKYENDSEKNSRGAEKSALLQATDDIRASVRSDGTIDGPKDEFERPEWEWRKLEGFTQQKGLNLSVDFPGPEREGGREHDVRHDSKRGRWFKYTKANSSGYTVDWDDSGHPFLRNASPLEYLYRLHLQNEVFKDDIVLEGLLRETNSKWKIVTSQPEVSGELATETDIIQGMNDMGFKLLPWRGIGREDALAFSNGKITVWDVHSGNVVRRGRLIVPIDVIIVDSFGNEGSKQHLAD